MKTYVIGRVGPFVVVAMSLQHNVDTVAFKYRLEGFLLEVPVAVARIGQCLGVSTVAEMQKLAIRVLV